MIVANTDPASPARVLRRRWRGLDYLVVPVVMSKVPRVHKRSGSLLPARVLNAAASKFDGKPVTLGHPPRGLGKRERAAWITRNTIGTVRRPRFVANRLIGQAWLESRRLSPTLRRAVLQGDLVDVSIGLSRVASRPAPDGATFNGRAVTKEVIAAYPDHLALVQSAKFEGECSTAEGCGLNNSPCRKCAAKKSRRPAERQSIVANLAGTPRRQTIDGKEWLIVPLTMIVPGVLAGSKGPLLYTAEEVARSAGAWPGVPLTIDHPHDPVTGQPLPANSPGVWERQGVGVVKRSRITRDGKLAADGWFDVDRTRRIAPRVLRELEAGRPVELSTGLFTQNEPAPPGAHHNGRGYDFVARNYRPDHLAILSDQTGACSIRDGCGANVTNSNPRHPRNTDPRSTRNRGTHMNDDPDLLLPPTFNSGSSEAGATGGPGDLRARSDDKLRPLLPDVTPGPRRWRVGDEVRLDTLEGDFHQPRKVTLYGEVVGVDEGGHGYLLVRFKGRKPVRVEAKYLLPAGFRGKQSLQRDGLDGEVPAANAFLQGDDPLALPVENRYEYEGRYEHTPTDNAAYGGDDALPYPGGEIERR